MTWVKLDDGFSAHPVIAGLSDAAFRLHVSALCYCARHLTDGYVPVAVLRQLGVGRAKAAAVELVEVGRWEIADDGYLIHDYLDYQESRAKVLDRRAKTAARVSKHRSNGVSPPVSNGTTNAAPDPSRTSYISSPAGRDRGRAEPKPSESYAAQDAKRRAASAAEPSRAEADAVFGDGLAAARKAARSLKVVGE